MEVGNVQQVGLPRPDPLLFLVPLALGAMAVATAVVAKMELLARWIVATVEVSAKGRGAALAQGMQGTDLPTVGTISGKMFTVALKYVRHFMIGMGHPYWP